ncbi:MAG: bifunctional phosphopantothenoylcysteine decarboxylase/phosphopantothenate--cysteine ligase CoaBC [Blastocatellia bacterium]|nr:bifunctional phosphopantothenoylcysteine decarboxylase/phosphopantothenate--cysteine ligase CoaBC [Blastocatellia bacterium]
MVVAAPNPPLITLGVTGCIGAYKAILILRGLQEAGCTVEVVMTAHAREFIQPLTFQALSGRPVVTDHWDRPQDTDIKHISLAQSSHLLLVAPATANIIAKFAHGIADDFLSTLYISATCPVLVCPAMNVEMWHHPATQSNLRLLRERKVTVQDPAAGYLACGMVGEGRLAEPETIVETALQLLARKEPHPVADLAGVRVLVTAGPTVEYLDPVRFLSNRSSGKMGYALASAARARGAQVTLVSGPVRLTPPPQVNLISVTTTREMYEAVVGVASEHDLIIKAAAVCDYRPIHPATHKIKKEVANPGLRLELTPTEDILAELGRRKRPDQTLVGFAAETEHGEDHAKDKLRRKGTDLLVLNDVSRNDAGFEVDTNAVTIFRQDRETGRVIPLAAKDIIANLILDEIVDYRKNIN